MQQECVKIQRGWQKQSTYFHLDQNSYWPTALLEWVQSYSLKQSVWEFLHSSCDWVEFFWLLQYPHPKDNLDWMMTIVGQWQNRQLMCMTQRIGKLRGLSVRVRLMGEPTWCVVWLPSIPWKWNLDGFGGIVAVRCKEHPKVKQDDKCWHVMAIECITLLVFYWYTSSWSYWIIYRNHSHLGCSVQIIFSLVVNDLDMDLSALRQGQKLEGRDSTMELCEVRYWFKKLQHIQGEGMFVLFLALGLTTSAHGWK